MLKNYFKIAFRNLWRDKSFSFINILGLALGMMCVLLILFYVLDELSFDQFFKDKDRIYRVAIDIKTRDNKNILFAPVAGPLRDALKEYPEVETCVRIYPGGSTKISVNPEKQFYEKEVYMADPNFFDIFSFPMVVGDPKTALAVSKDMVISRRAAERYFGKTDIIGEMLNVNGNPYHISGVFETPPANAHFQPDFVASFEEIAKLRFVQNWHATMFYTYIKLKPNTDAAKFESQIHDIAYKYVGDEIRNNAQEYRFFLQPVTSIHLHSDLRYELGKNNSYRQVQILGAVALIILLIACFNFINLATARATRRAKEVGIRKTVGSSRWNLVAQFMLESLLMCLISLTLALTGIELILPLFNRIADKQFSLNLLQHPIWMLAILGVLLLVGILAGGYPALILSRFQPQEVLKGRFTGSGRSWVRNQLVTLQFAISIALIVATVVVVRQLRFMQQQDLGFSKEQMLVLRTEKSFLKDHFQAVKSELRADPFVKAVTFSSLTPGREFPNNLINLKSDREKATDMRFLQVDDDFLNTYQIPLVAGRGFSFREPQDSLGDNVIINEAALPFFGWKTPQEAIGAEFGGGWGTVIGVARDFHYTSLQSGVDPLLIFMNPGAWSCITLKVNTENIGNSITKLEKQWKQIAPSQPFEYYFLDEDFDQQYRSEQRLGTLFTYFSGLAIFIACLGLLGLSAYVAERRTKEIGIRKVLGASASSILLLLSKDFMLRIAIAFLVAVPLSWLAMSRWLQDFAYRIHVQWWMFALAGLLALAIALFTISFQSMKAARANPVESLKTE